MPFLFNYLCIQYNKKKNRKHEVKIFLELKRGLTAKLSFKVRWWSVIWRFDPRRVSDLSTWSDCCTTSTCSTSSNTASQRASGKRRSRSWDSEGSKVHHRTRPILIQVQFIPFVIGNHWAKFLCISFLNFCISLQVW